MHKDIHIGGDPRNYLEFTEIRSEINKLSHPAAPDVDFTLIVSLSQELFRKNGVDLQTASYFTFAKTKLEGLAGFGEGCCLIAGLIAEHWQELWPESDTSRIEMLDWLNNRVGYDIRTFSFKASHIPLLIQLEQPLKQIADTLNELKLKKDSSVIELYKFIHNTRETLEIRAASQLKLQRKKALFPAEPEPVEEVKVDNPPTIVQTKAEQEPEPETVRINAQQPPLSINLPFAPTQIPRFKAWHGFLMGICLASAAFLTLIHLSQLQKSPLMDPQFFAQIPRQEIIQYANELQANPLRAYQPDLPIYQQQLTSLANQSPLASHFYADNLSTLITQLWPDSKKAAALKQEWQQHQNSLRSENPLSDGYSQAQKRITGLIRQINQAEAQGRTLSLAQLKSSLNAIQRQLNDSPPVEELLRQQADQPSPTAAQTKQIEQRLNGLLSHYHELITDNN
ncbi:VasL domain-containing protein [Pragia fontium]|uniref:Membrane protein n=1 Tax=Pragia fontium TaxID=82985 RepID=A0ABQ5LHR9_9GAMM|nr:VasL domain-containing protein [Pragia fontium]GKX63141.1 membrane protein [Pragia fontium]VEJ54396.1 Uncharacterized protein conserved in bacteria [Pragia fontium]